MDIRFGRSIGVPAAATPAKDSTGPIECSFSQACLHVHRTFIPETDRTAAAFSTLSQPQQLWQAAHVNLQQVTSLATIVMGVALDAYYKTGWSFIMRVNACHPEQGGGSNNVIGINQ